MFKQAIINSGETRAEWAGRLEISRSYLSDLINGKKMPSLELAVRIERMTDGGVPVASWVGQARKDRSAA